MNPIFHILCKGSSPPPVRCVYALYNPVSHQWADITFADAMDIAGFMDDAPGFWHGWKLATRYLPVEAC